MSDDVRGDLRAAVDQALDELVATRSDGVSTSRIGRVMSLSRATVRVAAGLTGRRLKKRFAGANSVPAAPTSSRTAERLMRTLGQMKGAAMKAGQMLSYVDDTLPPEYRKYLELLQTHSQPEPYETIQATIEREFGKPLEDVFQRFDQTPIASASIGQVHRAALHDGTEVAVKVQYDGIEEAMKADLNNAKLFSYLVQMMFPHSDAKGGADEIRQRFLDECDYELEAKWQKHFTELFAGHPTVLVPAVHEDFCTRRVLTTTFEQGVSFAQFVDSNPSEARRRRVVEAMARFYIGSLYIDCVFNCDPHPGNYIFKDDGRVVFLDYGCVRTYDRPYVERLSALIQAVLDDDPEQLHACALELDIVKPKVKYDRDAARELLRYLYAPILVEGPYKVTAEYNSQTFSKMILRNRNVFKLSLPPGMLFLNRINFGLMSVVAQLDVAIDWRHLSNAFRAGDDPTLASPR